MIKQEYKWLTDTFVAHRGFFNNVDIPENSLPAFVKRAKTTLASKWTYKCLLTAFWLCSTMTV